MSSQYFDESPNSDTKMDISEEAMSQESEGISPDTDDQQQQQQHEYNNRPQLPNTTNFPILPPTSDAGILIVSTNNTCTTTTTTLTSTHDLMSKLQEFSLDNRKNRHRNELQKPQISNSLSTRCCSLTLTTNSHPLMSPKSIADSENSPKKLTFNYPDVVPSTESMLRLKNSASTVNTTLDILSNNCNKSMALNLTAQPMVPVENETTITAASSDFQNSEDESTLDRSQYQANVTPYYQSVALVSLSADKSCIRPFIGPRKFNGKSFRKPVANDDQQSSNDETMSEHSFDNDSDDDDDDDDNDDDDIDDDGDEDDYDNLNGMESSQNVLVSASVSSNTMLNDNESINVASDNVVAATTTDANAAVAEDTRRNKQKIVLSDGKARDIDMKVIEPYKRVLSHGGYISTAGQNAIVVFSACHLPDRSRTDYHYVMDNLFFYVVKTLEQFVTEDYVLVYLHGGSTRGNCPPFPWLKKCYQLLDRRLRKRLKNLFMVHPTFWLKSIVWMTRPFISSKFWRKLIYVRTLDELYHLVPLERAAIPDKVKKYDGKYT